MTHELAMCAAVFKSSSSRFTVTKKLPKASEVLSKQARRLSLFRLDGIRRQVGFW